MRSYGQYCPVAKGAELLGDRWNLLIVRELLFGSQRFTDLERGLPGISRSVLTQRLQQLQRQGIVERPGAAGYRLTPAGEELREVLQAIGEWVARWIMGDPSPAELDPELLVLWISRRVRREALPSDRVVVEFDLVDAQRRRLWLILARSDVSMCINNPGFAPDITVRAATRDLYRVYMGRTTLGAEQDAGRVAVEGLPRMARAFPTWMAWSRFAPSVRSAVAS
jgi:DNA-binding HxlR family transcriptional regulator